MSVSAVASPNDKPRRGWIALAVLLLLLLGGAAAGYATVGRDSQEDASDLSSGLVLSQQASDIASIDEAPSEGPAGGQPISGEVPEEEEEESAGAPEDGEDPYAGYEPGPPQGPQDLSPPVSGEGGGPPTAPPAPSQPTFIEPTIIAVLDDRFDPYHYDFLGSQMPQHMDADTGNDLPLDQPPDTWIPGFPAPGAFASYGSLPITLPTGPGAVPDVLHAGDAAAWASVTTSTPANVHYKWIPGTKVIGWVNFGGGDGYASSSHGVGTSSVAVGNIHGSCPECLVVLVNGLGEGANRWLEQQSWIDAQSNSWGISSTGAVRDRIYSGSDTVSQRNAVERGQQVFFSAGNGVNNDFLTPNPTLMSSQEGPDWIVTVGAIYPDGSAPSGAGKPNDIAAIGDGYPSAGGSTVTAETAFGGTSNATPVTAGLYGRALHELRTEMAGMSRKQSGGEISVGALGCGAADPACATADGILTVHELRNGLFRAAQYTGGPTDVSGLGVPGTESGEGMYLAQGHGSYFARVLGGAPGLAQLDTDTKRIVDFLTGNLAIPQTAAQFNWFLHDSNCRQVLWGTWNFGYWLPSSPVPTPDPAWPARTATFDNCIQWAVVRDVVAG